jgi:hypothetical protein
MNAENSLLLRSILICYECGQHGGRAKKRQWLPKSVSIVYGVHIQWTPELIYNSGSMETAVRDGKCLFQRLHAAGGWSFPCTEKEGCALLFLPFLYNTVHGKITLLSNCTLYLREHTSSVLSIPTVKSLVMLNQGNKIMYCNIPNEKTFTPNV